MNELHEEIRQTMFVLNQENAQPVVEELQSHLANLFDMVRDELHQRLKERSWSEPSIGIDKQSEAPYKSVRIDCGDKQPLTVEDDRCGVLNDMGAIVDMCDSLIDCMRALYDAGYRKTGDDK